LEENPTVKNAKSTIELQMSKRWCLIWAWGMVLKKSTQGLNLFFLIFLLLIACVFLFLYLTNLDKVNFKKFNLYDLNVILLYVISKKNWSSSGKYITFYVKCISQLSSFKNLIEKKKTEYRLKYFQAFSKEGRKRSSSCWFQMFFFN